MEEKKDYEVVKNEGFILYKNGKIVKKVKDIKNLAPYIRQNIISLEKIYFPSCVSKKDKASLIEKLK